MVEKKTTVPVELREEAGEREVRETGGSHTVIIRDIDGHDLAVY